MKYLLDTAVFLWAANEQRENLSHQADRIITNVDNELLLSAVSVWEIAIKFSLKKLSLKKEPAEMITTQFQNRNLLHLTMTHLHSLQVTKLPFHHKDPFDRLLIAQAQVENLPIITPDGHFRKYSVEVIW